MQPMPDPYKAAVEKQQVDLACMKGRVDVISDRVCKLMSDYRRVECVGKLGGWFGHRFKVKIRDEGNVLVGFVCTRCGRQTAPLGNDGQDAP